MSALSTKILSYSPEWYWRFNDAYSLNPTNLGTGGTSGPMQLTNEAPIATPRSGSQGEGGWKFNIGNGANDTSTTRFYRFSTTTYQPQTLSLSDHNWSVGYWIKTNFTLSAGVEHPNSMYLGWFGGGTSSWRRPAISALSGGGASDPNKGKVYFQGLNQAYSPTRVDDQKWHYIAITCTDATTANIYNFYYDGQLVFTDTATNNTYSNTLTYLQFGNNITSLTAGSGDLTTFEIADYYCAPASTIGAAQIAQIYAAGVSGFYQATKALPTQPINWWSVDEGASDMIYNYGSSGGNDFSQNYFNLSGAPGGAFNWITGEVYKGIEHTSTWAGYDTNASWAPTGSGAGSGMTLSYWFKKSAPPTTAQNWLYWYNNSTSNIDSSSEAGITTAGHITFKPQWNYSGGPYTQSQVTTGMNVCDNAWHLITITYEGASTNNGTMKIYVDGVLKDTKSDWGNTSAGTQAGFGFGTASMSWDELQTWQIPLTATQILSLYQSEYPPVAGAPLKYWNGSSWAVPIANKQWNGTAWVTMVGKVYSGSAWVDIT